jgi:hypothetical protein
MVSLPPGNSSVALNLRISVLPYIQSSRRRVAPANSPGCMSFSLILLLFAFRYLGERRSARVKRAHTES